jgi:uncharacterized protein YjiS (DUF1127 family)
MRELVPFEAMNRQTHGRFSWVAKWWRNRIVRKDLRLLQKLDDHALRDIGLLRVDVVRLLALPQAVDLMWEVERVRFLRARG